MLLTCASCTKVACAVFDKNNMPTNCPSLHTNLVEESTNSFSKEPYESVAYHSARVSIDATSRMSRLAETLDFIKRSGYKNIGLAFCKMVKSDADYVAKLLRKEGYTVNSVICRVGSVSNELLEHEGENLIGAKGYVSMCNPVGQSIALEEAGCDFNIVLGLCVGHDTMFLQHTKTPCTVLGVKDKKLGCTQVAL